MENKKIDVFGQIEQVNTLDQISRTFHSFILKAEMSLDDEGYKEIEKTYQVYVNKRDLDYDLEDDRRYRVVGFEVSEGIIMAYYVDRWGRYCDACGAWHKEGYWVGECEYACSEECAIKLYNGDEEAFRADLALLDDDETANDAPTYWTDWD